MSKVVDHFIDQSDQINIFENSLTQTLNPNQENEKQEDKQQVNVYVDLTLASWLTAGSFLFEWLPNTITLFFIARKTIYHGTDAFGLGNMWIGCFGNGIVKGVAAVKYLFDIEKGLETLTSQAYGAGEYKLCGQLFNKAIAVIFTCMIFLFFPLFFFPQMFGLINQNHELLNTSGFYIKLMIFQVLIDGLNSSTKCFLNGKNIYNYQFYSQTTATLSHILWAYLFVDYLNLGLLGCAIARTITDTFGLLIISLIIITTKCADDVLVPFSRKYFRQWGPFLKVVVPIGSLLWIEFFCYELFSIQASYLSDQQLSAAVIMNSFATIYYQFSYGLSIAATTYVGNEMGNKSAKLAQKYAIASFVLTLIFLLISQLTLFLLKDQIILSFTSDQEVQIILKETFYLLQCFMVADSFQAIVTGVVRGVGKENFACLSFLFFYSVVGQLSSILFAFKLDFQLQGIYYGMLCGATGYIVLQILNLLISDWNKMVLNVAEKIESQTNKPNPLRQEASEK